MVINHPDIIRFSSIYEDYLRENTDRKFWLVNTNKLINFYDGADGLKTGHTDAAGYCLAATAIRNNLRLIGIVLGEEDSKIRNKEMVELLDYGFNNTKLKCLMRKDDVVDNISIEKGSVKNSKVVLKNDFCIIEEKNENNKYSYDIKYDNYKLPIKKGDIIGKIIVKNDKESLGEESITINQTIEKLNVFKYVKNNIIGLLFGI